MSDLGEFVVIEAAKERLATTSGIGSAFNWPNEAASESIPRYDVRIGATQARTRTLGGLAEVRIPLYVTAVVRSGGTNGGDYTSTLNTMVARVIDRFPHGQEIGTTKAIALGRPIIGQAFNDGDEYRATVTITIKALISP